MPELTTLSPGIMSSSRKRPSMEAALPSMMYGYGDAKRPDVASVKLVEAMVGEACARAAPHAPPLPPFP